MLSPAKPKIPMKPIVAVTARVGIEAADEPIGKTPRFTISPAYNGGPLQVGSYDIPVIVDLAGMTVNEQAVQAVLFHEETRLVGHVDTVQNDGRTLSLAGECSGLPSEVKEFVGSRRFPWHASIEARPLERPEYIPHGESVHVNGQHIQGPVLVARRSELYGVSFVQRGADEQTRVSIAAIQAEESGLDVVDDAPAVIECSGSIRLVAWDDDAAGNEDEGQDEPRGSLIARLIKRMLGHGQ